MENLTFNFTINQINLILKYLGSGAFIEVEPIITSIREQAALQLVPQEQEEAKEE